MKTRTSILILVAFLLLGGVLLAVRAQHEAPAPGSAGTGAAAQAAHVDGMAPGIAPPTTQKVSLAFLQLRAPGIVASVLAVRTAQTLGHGLLSGATAHLREVLHIVL